MRTIDADALKVQIHSRCDVCNDKDTAWCEHCCSVNDWEDYIDNAPTVDTTFREVVAYECGQKSVEERKGKWRSVGFEKGYAFCICSNCGNTTRLYRDSKNEFCCIADIRNKVIACLYCGADMRGEEE